ncbi:MAG: CHAT domain-containing protein, partial [Acidimicrobiales bacterium]
SGLRAVRERQHAANTSEVRAHIGRRLGSLASVGIRHAIRMNRPADVLVWSNELVETPPPPRQAPDATVRTLTFELRALSHELVREQAGEDPDRRGRLLRRQQAIHRRLRARQERNRHAPGAATAAAVAEARSDTALRVYAVDGDALHVVHNRGGRLELDSLTSVEELLAALRQLDFQLRSFLRSGGGEAKRRRLERQAVAVDRLLGLPGEGADGEISVFVPPVLGAIALGILPSLCGRPTLQTTMLGAQADRVGIPTGIVAVGGSDLIHATTEAETVGLSYRESTTLTGPAATCQAALRSMEGADVVHFAAHGRRSPDDPFFDAILLADGPLFTHELEWLERAPRIAVLASCESAVDHSLGDSQRLGVMPSLDRVGVWRTIASPYPLPDNDLTVSVMTNLHRRLARTGDPVGALAECAIDPDLADDALIIARSLVCRGRPVAGPDR